MVTPDLSPSIAPCSGADREHLLSQLDQEFILRRGRRIGLADRFPEALASSQSQFLAAKIGGEIASGLLLRRFDWLAQGRLLRGAMIGMVWTRPGHRGQGLGSAVMRAAAESARHSGCDFAVLWTAQAGFYSRLGWTRADCGLLGRFASDASMKNVTEGAKVVEEANVDETSLASIRDLHAGDRVIASTLRFRTLLPPATRLDALIEGGSYAVSGRQGDTGYVFEIGGDEPGLRELWRRLRNRYASLYLNLRRDSAAHRLLASEKGVAWEAQELAMWLPLTDKARELPYADWYIPFLDRV